MDCKESGCQRPAYLRGWCNAHYLRWQRGHPPMDAPIRGEVPMVDRFLKYVDKDGPGGCWLWTGGKGGKGYGRFRTTTNSQAAAHRLAYEWWVGPIPAGLEIDHLCRVKLCVNPEHLEAVTGVVNIRRAHDQSKCKLGHELTGDNLHIVKTTGARVCMECQRRRGREAYHRNKDERRGRKVRPSRTGL